MSEAQSIRARPGREAGRGKAEPRAPLVLMLSAAHPPTDLRIVAKEGAALAEAGWRVTHLAPAPLRGAKDVPASLAGVAITTYPRPTGWIGRLRAARALAARAARLKPDVIHAHEPDSWYAAILAAGRTGASVVLDVHEHYPLRLDGRLPGPFRGLGRRAVRAACRWMAARADAVVVAKDGLEDAFPEVEIVPVRNYAAAVPVEPREHRAGPVTLVHLGALTRERGAFEMLGALADCPEGTRLSLIGRFTDGCEADFLAEAKRLRLDGAVERHGWMPHEAAVARAAGADIGLVLFQPGHENHRLALPHKLFDCMLAGLPVIAPDFAEEVAAVVRGTGCGLLVDTASPEAIAGAVRELADPALRARMGAAGRAAALGRYGWAGEAARLVALYRDLAPLPEAALPAAELPSAVIRRSEVPEDRASLPAKPADPFAGLPAGGWIPPRAQPVVAPAPGTDPGDAFASLSAAMRAAPLLPAGAAGSGDPFASLSAAMRAASPPPAEPVPRAGPSHSPDRAPGPGAALASLSAVLRDDPAGSSVPRLLRDAAQPEETGGQPLPADLPAPRRAEAPTPSAALGAMLQALQAEVAPAAPMAGPLPAEGRPSAAEAPAPFPLLAGLGEALGAAPEPSLPMPPRPPVPPAPVQAALPVAGRPIEVAAGAEGARLLAEAGLSGVAVPASVAALLARPAEEPEAPLATGPLTSDLPLIEAGLRAAGPVAIPPDTSAWRLLQATPPLPEPAAPAAAGH